MTIPIALVGAGRMGAVHADVIAASRRARLHSVVDLDLEAGARVARGATVTRELHDVLGAVRGIVCASPTPLHAAIAAQAIAAGVHVLCEKPLSFEPTDSIELQAAAEAGDVVLGVGYWRRFARPWSAAKRLVDEGAIGDPVFVRLSQWDADPPPPAFCAREVSGGLFVDCGVHEFELLNHLLGQSIGSVVATALPNVDRAIAAVGDVDNGLVTATTRGGVVAAVDLSRNARYGDDVRTEILGSDGAMFVDGLPGGRLRLADRYGVRAVVGTEMFDLLRGGVTVQFDAFLDAIEGAPSLLADGRACAAATAAGLASWASLDESRSVEL